MKTIKKIAANKYVCIAFLVSAFVYGAVLPFCWGNNPMEPLGTLSLLCENHIPFFWIWAVLTGGCFMFNAQHMYLKFGYKNRFLDTLLILSVLGMFTIGITLGHSIEDWNPKRIAHWAGTVIYIVCIAAAVLLFFLLNIKIKGFKLLTFIVFLIIAGLAVWFVVFGKSGLMEVIPILATEILLFIVNFTPLVKAQKE
ncbi:MAG: hypothetical protein J1E34_06710 [Oscillospiraceae bacterium]|nr:hypothetical protein [Oscillospiraceae bacterium]